MSEKLKKLRPYKKPHFSELPEDIQAALAENPMSARPSGILNIIEDGLANLNSRGTKWLIYLTCAYAFPKLFYKIDPGLKMNIDDEGVMYLILALIKKIAN